ncbi:MAG: hypothetical protein ACK5JU_12610 [Bacteroidales bacterium]
MTTTKKYCITLAWALLLVFLIPATVKTIHLYRTECTYMHCSQECHGHHHSHNAKSCPVCQFTLPYYTEADTSQPDAPVEQIVEILYTQEISHGHRSILFSRHLRAPPSAA